jgi:NAD(P)-dependent dehydrogenase (short-subunit alcohol dehydrogenase family)
MLARTAERLADLAAEVPSAKAFVCDVSDQTQVDAALDLVEREMGAPSVLIHNAVGGAWGTFMEVDPATLNRTSKSTRWACSTSPGASHRPW